MSDDKNKKDREESINTVDANLTKKSAENKHEEESTGFWETIGETVTAGVETLKIGTEKLTQKAGDAANTAMLKVDIRNLQNCCDKLYLTVGKKLWQTDFSGQDLKTVFQNEIEQISALMTQIEEKSTEIKHMTTKEN